MLGEMSDFIPLLICDLARLDLESVLLFSLEGFSMTLTKSELKFLSLYSTDKGEILISLGLKLRSILDTDLGRKLFCRLKLPSVSPVVNPWLWKSLEYVWHNLAKGLCEYDVKTGCELSSRPKVEVVLVAVDFVSLVLIVFSVRVGEVESSHCFSELFLQVALLVVSSLSRFSLDFDLSFLKFFLLNSM